jgi:hypothetical protein
MFNLGLLFLTLAWILAMAAAVEFPFPRGVNLLAAAFAFYLVFELSVQHVSIGGFK